MTEEKSKETFNITWGTAYLVVGVMVFVASFYFMIKPLHECNENYQKFIAENCTQISDNKYFQIPISLNNSFQKNTSNDSGGVI